MNKLLIIFSITLISNISYASFPVIEKSKTESAQISNFGDNENRNILLLALAAIPLGLIAVITLNSPLAAVLFLLLATFSPLYSLYLNLNISQTFWDWRNYFAFLISVIVGISLLILCLGLISEIS
ncbi:MAG: hypothetical protein P8J36_01865 [Flavobacteriales bacterium]|nr:hypothetical protein [Flavobacteriales bacterium]